MHKHLSNASHHLPRPCIKGYNIVNNDHFLVKPLYASLDLMVLSGIKGIHLFQLKVFFNVLLKKEIIYILSDLRVSNFIFCSPMQN